MSADSELDGPSEEKGWGLLVQFVDSSPSFCHGFEVGTIWADLKCHKPVIDRVVHNANLEVLERIAKMYDMELRVSYYDIEWSFVSFCPNTIRAFLLQFLRWLTW